MSIENLPEYKALANRQISHSNVLIAKTKTAKAVTTAKFECTETGDYLYTNVRVEPISPFTGEAHLKSIGTFKKFNLDNIASLKEVASCKNCDTTWLASAAFIDGHDSFHCVVCNTELDVAVADDQYADDAEIELEDEDNFEIEIQDGIEELEEAVIEDDLEPETTDEAIITLDTEEKELTVQLPESATEEVQEAIQEVLEEAIPEIIEEGIQIIEDVDAAKEASEEDTSLPTEEEEMELPTELTEFVSMDQLPATPGEVISKRLLTANLATLLNKKEYKDKIEIVTSSTSDNIPKYYLMVNSIPVAVAEFEKASEAVQSIFSNPELFSKSLVLALETSTEESDTPLKDFGIHAITAPIVNASAALTYNVHKAISSMQATFKEKEKEMFNVWRESFTTATLLLCKGLLKTNAEGKPRSLVTKASLTDTLKATGISNADIIVEEAFKKGIQRDYGVIVEEALSLYAKTPEARQEVRDFVADAKYQGDAVFAFAQANINKEPAISEVNKHQTAASKSNSDLGSILSSLTNSIRARSI